jgi:hypothetical protein
VIAVTGLGGHAFGSWQNRETGQMWLKDFLPKDVTNIRVMSYGYNSSLVGDTVEDSFLDYRKSFIHSVLNVREGLDVSTGSFYRFIVNNHRTDQSSSLHTA